MYILASNFSYHILLLFSLSLFITVSQFVTTLPAYFKNPNALLIRNNLHKSCDWLTDCKLKLELLVIWLNP